MQPYEHYLEAEKLLEKAEASFKQHGSYVAVAMEVSKAQVHATLALRTGVVLTKE